MQRWRWITTLALALTAAQAAAAETGRLALARDGGAIVDAQAKLIWSRCPEGMSWDGSSCTGIAEFATWSQAAALAAARSKAEGVRWRVPSVAELRLLAKKLAAARTTLRSPFPESPQGWYWTASARVDTGAVNQYTYSNIQRGVSEKNVNRVAYLHAWVVDVDSGESRADMPRRSRLPVRLVRQSVE
ncbi:MAG: DUF1566 domain-containing protein [Burkholderiales bacterium]|nr:DUF1566 domain-containing protein [Burkholderiales bacterium]